MGSSIKLSDLTPGRSAVIQNLPKSGTAFVRLREMGLLTGTTVTLMRVAPLGDPIEIKIRGYNLSLRKSEADHVIVEPQGDSNLAR